MTEGDIIGSISGAAKGLDSGGIFAIFDSGVFAKIYFFLKILFWMVVVLGGLVTLYKFYLQYKIKITLEKRIGTGSVETVNDSAKIVTDTDGKRKLQLFKTKKGNKQACTCPIPEAKYLGKSGRKDHYHLWLDDNYELHPVEPPIVEDNFERLIIRPQERDAWRRLEDDRLMKKYKQKDKLLQYATPAILMTACITAFLIFFFASKEIGSGLTALAGSFQQVASNCISMNP